MISRDLNTHNMGEIRKLAQQVLNDVVTATKNSGNPIVNFLLEGASKKIRKIYDLTKF